MTKQLTIESVKSDIESLNGKIERLTAQLEKAKSQRDALETVIELYVEAPKRRSKFTRDLDIDPVDLRGFEPERALIHIAERNEGELSSTGARELLERAGVLSGPKTKNDLWNILQSSESFEKVGRGRYRLVDGIH